MLSRPPVILWLDGSGQMKNPFISSGFERSGLHHGASPTLQSTPSFFRKRREIFLDEWNMASEEKGARCQLRPMVYILFGYILLKQLK
jgi:hypothetical protein